MDSRINTTGVIRRTATVIPAFLPDGFTTVMGKKKGGRKTPPNTGSPPAREVALPESETTEDDMSQGDISDVDSVSQSEDGGNPGSVSSQLANLTKMLEDEKAKNAALMSELSRLTNLVTELLSRQLSPSDDAIMDVDVGSAKRQRGSDDESECGVGSKLLKATPPAGSTTPPAKVATPPVGKATAQASVKKPQSPVAAPSAVTAAVRPPLQVTPSPQLAPSPDKKKKRTPAIIAYARTANPSAIANFIHTEKVLAEMTVKNGRITVLPKSQDDHGKLWSHMINEGIQAHTNSAEAPTFPRKWIMRGMSGCIDTSEIEADISAQIGCPVKATRLTRHMRGGPPTEREGADLFAVVAETSDYAKIMREVRVVYHHKVTWEQPNRPDLVQCYRCQRFGHTSKYCNYERRCVKCPNKHDMGCCANEGASAIPFCVNCNNAGHPANFKGCPYRQKIVLEAAKLREIRAAEASHKATGRLIPVESARKVLPGRSFAVAAGAIARPLPPAPGVATPSTPSNSEGMKNILGIMNRIDLEMAEFQRLGGDLSSKAGKDLFLTTLIATTKLNSL